MEAAAPSRRKSHRAFVAILLSVVFSVSYNFSKFRSWKPLEEENGLHESLVTENNKPKVAGLSCPAFPLLEPSRFEAAQRELVYWRDIPDDSQLVSPYTCSAGHNKTQKFLTFEPDEGGWNNARMAAETAITMAIAMGRVLVLPPTTTMYLLWETSQYSKKTHFGFMDFFPLELLQEELAGLEIMTFQEFLEQEVLKGHVLADPHTGEPLQPPGGKTKWDGSLNNWESGRQGNGQALWQWWRSVATPLPWKYYECTAVFPTPSQQCDDQTPWNAVTEADEQRMRDYMKQILQQEPDGSPQPRIRSYDGNPTAVDASPLDRLSEMVADRRQLCIYDRTLQEAPVLHAMGQQSESTTRFLVHFYAFVFLEDWRHDIWLKRLVRDHLRYVDEIQCAASRIVAALHEKAYNAETNPEGLYHSMHVRRGDFQRAYVQVVIPGEVLYEEHVKDVFEERSTIYIATDEKDAAYFAPLAQHYNLFFMRDFMHLLEDVNPNYFGMIDQVVASTGQIFIGTFLSTFSGYINRLRGYRTRKSNPKEITTGNLKSFYYYGIPDYADKKKLMQRYHSVEQAFWTHEFPVGWRDLDHGVTNALDRRRI
ncbi:hypothetical protein FisN_10Hh301 [Fistulifera solaris]|uniref:Uncharacterized protein n=1 Tax=Fistulifera solaris TaxID=1519565 RepID=A0A1Z5JXL9_FISSO|nr:hypothetical protein FisN_10Hh301 [Fistulifera solaris]|eukprot:GAX18501.1 hypothetical protein FisN_10Hh301 [Fistulifera solaris]